MLAVDGDISESTEPHFSTVQISGLSRAERNFGTPLFLYDQVRQGQQYNDTRAHLPDRIRINYALKANGSLAVADRFRALGAGIDVCSCGELAIAMSAGFTGRDILYTGPAKTADELEAACAADVGLIAVESLGEALRLNDISTRRERVQPVLFRVHQREAAGRGGAMRFTSDKFGFTEEQLIADLPLLHRLSGLELEGLLYHTESCVTDVHDLLTVQQAYLASAQRIAAAGLDVSHVDLGGGIGVPYEAHEPKFDIAAYGQALAQELRSHPAHWTYALDLGRYLIAESGTLLLSVVDVRQREGRRWIFTDGGLQVLNRPRFRKANALAGTLSSSEVLQIPTSVAGPLLTPDDVLIDEIALPHVEPGDIIWIANVGAYGFSHGLQGFCLARPAAEAAIDGSKLSLIRERPSPDDALLGQHLDGTRPAALA